MAKRKPAKTQTTAESYQHADATVSLRPEVGTQSQFKKQKPPAAYQYDSSLAPELQWDGQNAAREVGESLLAVARAQLQELRKLLTTPAASSQQPAASSQQPAASSQQLERHIAQAEEATRKLVALGKPFLNWTGKAERLSFEVPTLPLFVHERLSTQAILQTLKGHKRDKFEQLSLFADPQHSITDQVLRAYEHRDRWTNRMVLGDSLVVMNSLVHYEGLGGQVQMIYMDPPYGVKFGSNFQPFVRRRDVKHNDDEDLTREPEMVQAYRDTWELGLHSYLTYLRDRLLVARELLAPSGSLFVQISDENLHHVREVMDEVFGAENFVAVIPFLTTSLQTSEDIGSVADYLLWFAKDREMLKYRQLYADKDPRATGGWGFNYIEEVDGSRRPLSSEERSGETPIPQGKLYMLDNITSQGTTPTGTVDFEFNGTRYHPGPRSHWKTTLDGMRGLAKASRIQESASQIRYVRFFNDFPVQPLTNLWTDTTQAGYVDSKLYVVQTLTKVLQRCLLMTTDPGDLVLDPTCGSGTTAYVAEQWGRRWITIDVSRVPLALARQRLLTATFPWYELADEPRGPAGGFSYRRKQNSKGEETGGIVPHVTLKSIANNEPPAEEVLVDRPETKTGIIRVTGPFCFEATIPTADGLEGETGGQGEGEIQTPNVGTHVERMLEVLRRSPVLRLGGNRTVTLKNVRVPAKSLSLSAEAMVEAETNGSKKPTLGEVVQEALEADKRSLPFSQRPVAFVFGPENGAVSERLVNEALKEAHLKSYSHLYVIGFSIQPHARTLVENSEAIIGLPATYVQATPDLLMGDLLKNMRSSQIFSVCGLPDVEVVRLSVDGSQLSEKGKAKKSENRQLATDNLYQVKLLGLDTFDPVTMDPDHLQGDNVPAWFLDTDYNDLCFHVSQAFFPRTSAWDNLKKALKGTYEESVWDHLAGTTSAPFEPGDHGQIAVKVIDDRGNELLVVKKL